MPLVCQDNSILYGKVFSLTSLMFPPQVRCTFYNTSILITFDTEAQYTYNANVTRIGHK